MCQERLARCRGGGRILLGHSSWHFPGPLLSRVGQVVPLQWIYRSFGLPGRQASATVILSQCVFRGETPWWGAELKTINRASEVISTREQKRGGYSWNVLLSLNRIQCILTHTFTFWYKIRYLAH